MYCFNVDVFVFGKKLLRAYVFCLYYMPNWNKVLLTYLLILLSESVLGKVWKIPKWYPEAANQRRITMQWRKPNGESPNNDGQSTIEKTVD